MKRVLLLDGYNMLYRARSGWTKGDHAVVYNFFRSFRATVGKFKPNTVYFVLEGMPRQRLAEMPEYKAQREYHDRDNFQAQKRMILDLLRTRFPVRVVQHPDYECDDVLAALCTEVHSDDECIVVSSDTDFYQLLQTHKSLQLYNPVRKKFIETPECDYVVWKALKGDPTDNVQGFRGVGDKRAAAMAQDETLLEAFLSKGDNREKFELNKRLIRFHTLGEDRLSELRLSFPEVRWSDVRDTFRGMAFNSITNDKSWRKFVDTFEPIDTFYRRQGHHRFDALPLEMKVKRDLTERDLVTLRQRGLILSEETAFWVDDDLVVENVLTKQQRVLGRIDGLILESKKRILKG